MSALVTGQVEKSGTAELRFSATRSKIPVDVDVELKVSNRDLADLNAFFVPNAGLEFSGKLHRGRPTVAVREAKLTAQAWGEYDGLKVKLSTDEKRGETMAFLETLVAKAAFVDTDVGDAPKDQSRGVIIERKEDETIIAFILRGMKEAAIKVARKT